MHIWEFTWQMANIMVEKGRPEFLLLEGQSTWNNPSGPCIAEWLLWGKTGYERLVYAPRYMDKRVVQGKVTLPYSDAEMALINAYGSQVLEGVLTTGYCSPEKALEIHA